MEREITIYREIKKEYFYKHTYTFWEYIFSVRNEEKLNKDYYYKIICILGIKIRIKIKK